MDQFRIVLIIKYKHMLLCFKKDNRLTFPMLICDDLFSLTSSSSSISQYFNSKKIPSYFIESTSRIYESSKCNVHYSFKYIIVKIEKEPELLSNERLIPFYYLNANYFNDVSRLYVKWFNSEYPIEDIPLSAREIFADYYLRNNYDYYLEIKGFVDDVLSKKGNNGIFNEFDAVNVFFRRNRLDFVIKNKNIFKESIILNYCYHDRLIV